MTLTEKEKQELSEKEVKKEIDNLWKILNYSLKIISWIIFFTLLGITINYLIKGFTYGFI